MNQKLGALQNMLIKKRNYFLRNGCLVFPVFCLRKNSKKDWTISAPNTSSRVSNGGLLERGDCFFNLKFSEMSVKYIAFWLFFSSISVFKRSNTTLSWTAKLMHDQVYLLHNFSQWYSAFWKAFKLNLLSGLVLLTIPHGGVLERGDCFFNHTSRVGDY